FLDVGVAVRDRQSLDVTSPVEKLVLQREVSEKRLAEWLRLLGHRLHRGCGTPQQRADDIGKSAEIADRGLDGLRASTAIRRILSQLAADGFGAGLDYPGLGDLDLGVGQIEHSTELRQ